MLILTCLHRDKDNNMFLRPHRIQNLLSLLRHGIQTSLHSTFWNNHSSGLNLASFKIIYVITNSEKLSSETEEPESGSGVPKFDSRTSLGSVASSWLSGLIPSWGFFSFLYSSRSKVWSTVNPWNIFVNFLFPFLNSFFHPPF